MNYDLIKDRINTSIENSDPDVSTETGTMTSLVISGCAAPIAGCYGYLDTVGRKPFPDLCSRPDLEHWAAIKGLRCSADDDDEVLRSKVLDSFRIPPSGGSARDWNAWVQLVTASAIETRFKVLDNARGLGSIDVVLGHKVDGDLAGRLRVAVENNRPLGLADVQVSQAVKTEIEVKLVVAGATVDGAAVVASLSAEFGPAGTHKPAVNLYRSRIEAVAVGFGAETADMYWKFPAETNWISGSCAATRTFVGLSSVYQHLVVTSFVVEIV